jgi:ABC-type lipoprotein export system ATPase subunit
MPDSIVICDNLVKIYKVADLEVVALQGLDLEVMPGEVLAIVGASGSGKSTFLNILSGLDTPSAGSCIVDGYDLTRLTQAQRIHYRRQVVGQLWQQSGRNLLPDLTAQANVELPQMLNGVGVSQRSQRAKELLALVGLAGKEHKRPNQLSSGEQRRNAIAVALANQPKLLLADEPTGELDAVTAAEIFALFRSLNNHLGLTIITVTYDATIAAAVDRTIAIRDGRTSMETVRRETTLETLGEHLPTIGAVIGISAPLRRESLLIDQAGRLQLPKEVIEQLPFNGRAEVRIMSDHVEIWPIQDRLIDEENDEHQHMI